MNNKASNTACLAELCRYPLIFDINKRILEYISYLPSKEQSSLVIQSLVMSIDLHRNGKISFYANLIKMPKWMNECVFIYRTYHIMFHGGLQCYWVRTDFSLWGRLWLPLSVHTRSHSPTQPMHEMWDESRERSQPRELHALLFFISVWVLQRPLLTM